MASTTIPFSNSAGNNQMSPGSGLPGGGPKPMPVPFAPGSTGGGGGVTNQYFTPPAGATPVNVGNGMPGGGGASQGGYTPLSGGGTSASLPGGGSSSSTNPLITQNSSYSSGENDLEKQLIDIYGKGVGGSMYALLQGSGGADSAEFQQYLQSMKQPEAAETASLNQGLGASGVSGNSSVSAIANSNLQGQFNSQASAVDAQIIGQNTQNTLGLLEGTSGAAQKEVASSGWTTFANVMNNITGDIGNLTGGSYQSPEGQSAAGSIPGSNFQPVANMGSTLSNPQAGVGAEPGYTDFSGMDTSSIPDFAAWD